MPLSVELIKPGDNARKTFDAAALQELADNIRQHGILQAILLRKLQEENGATYYRIVAGERRFRACLLNEYTELDDKWYVVREMTDEQEKHFMLTENLARKDLAPLEEMEAFLALQRDGFTVAEIAALVGTNEDRVRNRILLDRLTGRLKRALQENWLPLQAAEIIAESDIPRDGQLYALRAWLENNYSAATFVQIVRDMVIQLRQTVLFDYDTYWRAHSKGKIVLNGKSARFRAVLRSDLPPVPAAKGKSTGEALYEYMNLLEAHGLDAEAGVVGVVLRALVDSRNVTLPVAALLDEDTRILS